MENWHKRFTLSTGCLALSLFVFHPTVFAEEALTIDDLGLTPDIDRREVKIDGIDTENFEIGVSGGLFSVEDFETNPIVVTSLTYHITEDFFAQARYAQSELGESSFDRLSGGASLLGTEDDQITFYDLSLGYNMFPGEAFIFDRWAVNSSFYLVGGVGSTEFAGSERFTINAGVGYQLIANDFLSFNVQVRDHMFDTEITGSKKTTHNVEMSAGLSVFF